MAAGTLDLTIAELLTARLCHELVSPIGAIANGLEILEEEPDFAGDAASLIALSARVASRRLQFYRIAYGSTANPAEAIVCRAVSDFFIESKIAFEWRVAALPNGSGKLAANLVLLAAEALPRGGRVTLDAAGGGGLSVEAAGEGARLTDAVRTLLVDPGRGEQLSTRTVQAAFTAALAARAGATVTIRSDSANELALLVRMKP